jgi:PDZ domain-containing secreted protein
VEVAAPPRSRPRPFLRRILTPTVALTIGAILLVTVVTLELVSSRDYIFLPDKAHPVAPLVRIAGGRDPAGSGGIYFVDVIVRKATLLEQLFGGLHSGADLYPANEVVPPGVSSQAEEQVNAAEMRTSQQVAAAVALRSLGKKVTTSENGALVSQVEQGFPAARGLRPTDVIVAVNGKRVESPADVSRLMRGARIGSAFRFTILRGGRRFAVALTTVAAGPRA